MAPNHKPTPDFEPFALQDALESVYGRSLLIWGAGLVLLVILLIAQQVRIRGLEQEVVALKANQVVVALPDESGLYRTFQTYPTIVVARFAQDFAVRMSNWDQRTFETARDLAMERVAEKSRIRFERYFDTLKDTVFQDGLGQRFVPLKTPQPTVSLDNKTGLYTVRVWGALTQYAGTVETRHERRVGLDIVLIRDVSTALRPEGLAVLSSEPVRDAP